MFVPARSLSFLACLAVCLVFVAGASLGPGASTAVAQTRELVPDGDFETTKNGDELREDSKGLDWYESRHDTDAGTALLKLSTKNIGGNKTKKAMVKSDPELNTYLSYRLAEPQTVAVSASFDIYVKEILPDDNRSAFIFLGRIKDKNGGPNSTGSERFVFLGFENASEPGKINLFAREGQTKWSERTLVASDLDLKTWLTIKIEANIPEGFYTVAVDGRDRALRGRVVLHQGQDAEQDQPHQLRELERRCRHLLRGQRERDRQLTIRAGSGGPIRFFQQSAS